jgi:hypothetical protein
MMRARRLILIVLICGLFLCLGNAPAPYYACAGKAEGDPCTYGYGCSGNGTCKLVEACEDDPNTEINECLQCNSR